MEILGWVLMGAGFKEGRGLWYVMVANCSVYVGLMVDVCAARRMCTSSSEEDSRLHLVKSEARWGGQTWMDSNMVPH